jgi:hypothetical protein
VQPTQTAEELVSDLADELDIPAERYESAERSYKSVSAWLERPDSRFAKVNISVYTQGSFRLGTVIKPISGDEHYDLDIVCEFSISKLTRTQKQLHDDLGEELKLYAARYNMDRPTGWDRCWTLNYADSAQFHMDVLPSVPDGLRQRQLREERSLSLAFVEKSVSITDSNHENYQRRSEDWPVSNPNGFAEWFYERMKAAFEQRRKALMLAEAKADVSEIPAFRVKTPLQSAIQILKRHRDIRFSEDADGRPSSIIITTLSAQAYQQESSIIGALFSILTRMDAHIERRGTGYWIANPSDPRENFADSWNDQPEKKEAFYDWLDTARIDFETAAERSTADEFVETLSPRMGRELVEAAAARKRRPTIANKGTAVARVGNILRRIWDAPHRKPLAWPKVTLGTAWIASAVSERRGFRPTEFANNDPTPRTSGSSLTFVAETDVTRPYKVYWQIVNMGPAAKAARKLRGGFDEVAVEAGKLTKKENASYAGSHSIECFIIKDGYCAAQSGPFIVNVA